MHMEDTMERKVGDIGRDIVLGALVISMGIWWWYSAAPKEPRDMLEYSVKIETFDVVAPPHARPPAPPPSPQAPPADPPKTDPQTGPKEGPEEGGGSYGSGTVIGYIHHHLGDGSGTFDSVILTAYHVVKDTPRIVVSWKGKGIKGRVIARDPALDLALIQVPVRLPKVELLAGPIWDGENTWVVGYPFGLNASITHGFISPKGPDGPSGLRQESGSIWFGNSGGGVFVLRDGRYVLAGVADAIYVKPYMGTLLFATTVGFFVPVESVKKFLVDNHVIH